MEITPVSVEGGFGPENSKKIARPWGERIHGEVERRCVPRAAKNRTMKRGSAIPMRLLIIYIHPLRVPTTPSQEDSCGNKAQFFTSF